ncbi:aromatic/alkene/methane monooxygenase hydroxylase/oxygenase subunit alpha [Zavarzinia aquatilis]|uniref:Toluene monooxygenase n=1 Tax=Zavarzinia aquatilis TaxID=2211142 RepID=A0A317DT44_9PROT|nr:aromatic/alkene/methane monooxygenase hydroxylase/oxygenase subunit alpha [Zavarzinia aquatilis]PWR17522.1 toluene monooxygenase [Zavarzinia aquatilis]
MSKLASSEYYDLVRTTNWTPRYVTEAEMFPEAMSGSRGIPAEAWETFDEPYKVTYSDYVATQREKDAGAYSVKAALERANYIDTADPGWVSTLQAHYGALAVAEYGAATAEARMARFARAPGNRNMATFGMLDEMRHGQIQLFFPHEHTKRSRQWDWAHKAMHTNEWAALAARHMFDDMMFTRDAVSVAIMLTFAFETGFTNMQFLGLAADAAEAGDHTFASLISSVQTDESRHAQQGGPVLKILIANGKKDEAQKMIDVIFWRAWKLFSVLTGPILDYYTPLEHRKQSFKEFMEEWIIGQFERQLKDLGLDLPWYWDEFVRSLDETHHGMHMGVWYWRPTVWWNPAAGVSPEERDWLEEKYPGWNSTFGRCWDVITENLQKGREDLTLPETLPTICNMCNLPVVGTAGDGWNVRDYQLVHNGRLYHFGSEVDRWCFQQDPERYQGHMNVVDRFLSGEIQPQNLAGALLYMGLNPGEIGSDAHNYAWAGIGKQNQAAE